MVLWANKAARHKFGRPREAQEVLDWWAVLSDKIKPAASATLRQLYTTVQVGVAMFLQELHGRYTSSTASVHVLVVVQPGVLRSSHRVLMRTCLWA